LWGSRMDADDNICCEMEPVMLSALEHYAYCPRQCALIHVEQTFDENIYTMRGRAVHENVDVESCRHDGGMRVERALPLWSKKLGLTGKADVVEFHEGVPYPVDYKSGKKGKRTPESVQLCGQALCLEEMLGMPVPKGALFFHGSRDRAEVVFTEELRRKVETTAVLVREMLGRNETPPPVNDERCANCSLNEACIPAVVGDKRKIRRVLEDLYSLEEGGGV